MPITSRYEHYRGYDIVAVGEACEILRGDGRVDRFTREYLRMNIPDVLILAMLIDEAEERIDASFNTAACPSRLTMRRRWRALLPAQGNS